MTRQATLYTAEKKSVLVTSGVHELAVYQMQNPKNFSYVRDSGEAMFAPEVEIQHLPIRRFVESNNGFEKVSYVAFDRELQRLMDYTVSDLVSQKLKEAYQHEKSFEQKLNEFNQLPWYKRIYKTLKGGI